MRGIKRGEKFKGSYYSYYLYYYYYYNYANTLLHFSY